MADFEWLTRHDAAKRLKISPNTLKSRRSRGLIESKHDRDGRLVFKVPKNDELPELDHWQAVKDLAKPQTKERQKSDSAGSYRIISLFDVHVPEADAFAFRAVLDFIKDQQPDHIVLGGDFLELESCSMHGGNANPKALVDEIKAGQKAIQRLRDAASNAQMTYLEGNHETRLSRVVVSSLPALDGALDVPSLLHLKDQGIEWVPYRKLWFPSINGVQGKLAYTHGEWATNHHAAKHLQMYGVSVRYGHTHRPQTYSRGFADGRVAMALGSPCLRTLDPSWAGPHNGWLHGFGLDEFFDDGRFTAQNVVMAKRRFAWGGKVYG